MHPEEEHSLHKEKPLMLYVGLIALVGFFISFVHHVEKFDRDFFTSSPRRDRYG